MPAGTPLFVWLDIPLAGPAMRAIIEIMQLIVKKPEEAADLLQQVREIVDAARESYAESSINPMVLLSLPARYGRVGDSDLEPVRDLSDRGLIKRNTVSLPGVGGPVTVAGLGTFSTVSAAAFGLKNGVVAVGYPTSAGLSSGNWGLFEKAVAGALTPAIPLHNFVYRRDVGSRHKPRGKDQSHKP